MVQIRRWRWIADADEGAEMTSRILFVWASRERQRRATNRLLLAVAVISVAMVAGCLWGLA